jgi:hypothetical protein
MANMPAFQASDESSILSARTKEKTVSTRYSFFFGLQQGSQLVILKECEFV